MKKQQIRISNQEEFNKHLQHTSITTWVVLGAVIVALISFFLWSFIYKIDVKLTGKANVTSGTATLQIDDSDLNKLKVGQKVYIQNKEGEILSFNDDQPMVSSYALDDGEYTYKIVLRQLRPIDFLLGKR